MTSTSPTQPSSPETSTTNSSGRFQHVINRLACLGDRIEELGRAVSEHVKNRPPQLDVLSLEKVIAFFSKNRDSAADATAAALVRQRDGDEYLVTLVFLDVDGSPLTDGAPTRTYRVADFDDELGALLADNDTIIFG